jgi:iron complex transport system substrate-binding protein
MIRIEPMKIDRRTLIGGLASALVVPRRVFAASVTDASGRTVTAPDHVMRVYPAGPPAGVVLYTLAPDLVAGWVEAISPEDREFLLPDIAARPKVSRITGRGNSIDLTGVDAIKPDLILDVGNVDASFVSIAERVQQQAGIPYVLLDGHFDQMASTYRALGRLIGRDQEAEKLARYAETTTATIKQRVAGVPNEARPRVYYARDRSGMQTAQGGSMVVEAVEFMGARNVAGERRGGQTMVTVEQVVAWNPEIIVASDADFAKEVRNDPAWAAIAAVKAGRVYAAPRLPFGWVDYPPAVNRLIGLWWLGKTLYPDRFPEDIKAMARDFYTMFYHVTPSAAQIDRVLGT